MGLSNKIKVLRCAQQQGFFFNVLTESLFACHFQILPGQKMVLLSAFIFHLQSHTFLFHRKVFFTFSEPILSPHVFLSQAPPFYQSLWLLSPPVQARIIYLRQHLGQFYSAVIFCLLLEKLTHGKNEHTGMGKAGSLPPTLRKGDNIYINTPIGDCSQILAHIFHFFSIVQY